MATIRKLQSGKWQALVRRKGFPDQVKSFSARSDAHKWARLIETDQERGQFLDRSTAEDTTLGELMDRYIREVTPKKRSSVIDRQRMLYLKRHFGHFTAASLRSQHVAAWRDMRLGQGKAGSTVVKEINALSHLIDTAIKDWGIGLTINPARLIRKPPEARGRNRRLDTIEEKYLLEASGLSHSPLMTPLITVAIETAMRLGELLALTWQDVSLEERTALLRQTKNGEVRRVPLSSRAVQQLSAIPRNADDNRVFWSWKRSDSFSKSWIRRVGRAKAIYKQHCQQEAREPNPNFLADLRFHDLRHEGVSRLFEKGLNVMEVSSISGHKTLQMLKRYTHPKIENLLHKLG